MEKSWLTFCLLAVPLFSPLASPQSAEIAQTLKRGQPEQALHLANDLLARDPKNFQAWTFQGLSLAALHHEKEGLASLHHALDLSPDYLPALQASAQLAYSLHDPSAPQSLHRLLQLNPHNQVAHAMLGSLQSDAGNCTAALPHFQAAASLVEANPAALLQYGSCQLARKQNEDAATTFRKLLAMRPEDPAARYKLALALGNTEEALSLLKGLPPNAQALRLLAQYYARRKDPLHSAAALRQAIALVPLEDESYLDLATLYIEAREPQQALDVMNQALQRIQPTPRLLTVRGAAFLWLNDTQHAASDFTEADNLAPEQLYGAVGLSMLLRTNQQLPQAVALLRTKLAGQPDDPTLQYLLADTLIRTGVAPGQPAFQEAVSLLRRTISLDRGFGKADVALGKLYMQSSRPDQAIDCFREALRLAPDDRSALSQLVLALRRSGRAREAEASGIRLRALIAADERLPSLP